MRYYFDYWDSNTKSLELDFRPYLNNKKIMVSHKCERNSMESCSFHEDLSDDHWREWHDIDLINDKKLVFKEKSFKAEISCSK